MAAPKTRRISGIHSADSKEGKIAKSRMLYATVTDGQVHPDYNAMAADIKAYLDTPETIHNPAGYRAALRNVGAAALNLWLAGYTCTTDAADEDVEPNERLIEVMTAGRNALINTLYNQDSKYQSQLVIRTLEGMGELTPQKKIVDVNLSGLGSREQWAK